MATKNKLEIINKFDKYQVWWIDHISHNQWKSISEAKKDRPAIAFTEGYLLSKDKHCHNFFMSISEDEMGEEMIIYNKNIVKIKKVGSIEFTKEDFEFDTYKD